MTNLRRLTVLGIVALASIATVPAFGQERQRDGARGRDGAGARARDGAGGGPRTGERIQFLQQVIDQLNLTDEQKTKIQPIVTEAREKIRTAIQAKDREGAQAAMRSAVEQVGTQLTEEQRTKLRELMRDRAGGGPTSRPAMDQADIVGRMRQAVADLNLSDDQKTKLDDLFKVYAAQIADIRKNAGGNEQAAREQIRPLRNDLLEKVKANLTPEQSEKLQEKIQAFRERGAGERPNQGNRANQGDRPQRQRERQGRN